MIRKKSPQSKTVSDGIEIALNPKTPKAVGPLQVLTEESIIKYEWDKHHGNFNINKKPHEKFVLTVPCSVTFKKDKDRYKGEDNFTLERIRS